MAFCFSLFEVLWYRKPLICAYLACFGIYPYFHKLLIEKIRAVKYYILSFDESLNQINQKKQIDMIVRFWNSESNKVAERYFNSEFMGHATTADMLTHFRNGMALLNPSSLVQISMADPNVNWKFYRNLFQERKGEELPELQILEFVVCMLSMEVLKWAQKNLDGILAILCDLCGKFFMILQPEGKILFKSQAMICIPFGFVSIDG